MNQHLQLCVHFTKATGFKNRTVAYEYGTTGERTKLVYADGREVIYNYDDKLQLKSIIGNGEETTYAYDEIGRLVSKNFANGVSKAYTYMPGGNLASMVSSDNEGVLDRYFYSYDNSGLINGIDRNRRGLDKVSGRYEYSYDAIGRLIKSTHDGITKAAYEYDAFGNRTSMSEASVESGENIKTAYTYDVLDRLVEAKELNNSQAILKTYDYDKRGNQTKEFINGLLQKTFTFDATNMLSKVVDKDKGELENCYNGLGFRVESTRPEERIEYLCDLSKDYYNLLERTVNGETESFVYDNNVISMSKSGNNFYYLQDELGSPMYMTGTDGATVSSYAYDDFGRNIDPFTGKIRNNRNQNTSKHAYTTNGNIIQPFAFTGYQEDEISGLKFAQARFYSAEKGRFVGEDQFAGAQNSSSTLNKYLYCENSPIDFVDNNGKWLKRKDFNAYDIAAVGIMTIGTVAAGFGAVAIGLAVAASAPVSLPLIAAGAVVGAGVAYDASVISDWKDDKHANLQKANDNAVAGAAIGATAVWSAGVIAAEGLGGIATVLTNKFAKATIVGSVNGLSNTGTGGSFGAGFIGGAVNNLMTSKSGGLFGNINAGFVGNTVTEALNIAEGTSTKSIGEIAFTSSIYSLFQGVVGGVGDIYGDLLNDKFSRAAWAIINDVLRQGPLGFANYLIADKGAKKIIEKLFDNGGCE